MKPKEVYKMSELEKMQLEITPQQQRKFRFPLKDKKYCYIHIPEYTTIDEWDAINQMMLAYIIRAKKVSCGLQPQTAKIDTIET